MPATLDLSPELIQAVYDSDDAELQELLYLATSHPYYTFEPRPDCPDEFDEQTGFIDDRRSKFCVLLGGTGSGKTAAAAVKTARYVLENPPPRDRCPFWIIGETYDQICQAAWVEKLSQLIPSSEIHSYVWYRSGRRWPYAVLLRRPEPDRRNEIGWILEFKSYEQGFQGMKAVSIGGYWCNEEIPFHLVFEIQGRCRDYDSPGWADFTPVECRDPEWPLAYDDPPPGWKFYHLNSLKNEAENVTPDGRTVKVSEWAENYLATIPEDMREMRQYGRFTSLQGAVFKEFRKSVHVIDWARFRELTGSRRDEIPHDWRKIRGMDFGFNNPFACHWIARDKDDRYYVYEEHYEAQRLIEHHVAAINRDQEAGRGLRYWDASDPHYGPTYSDHDPQVRAELAKLGISTTLANKSESQGIEMLRSLMIIQKDNRPKLYVLSHCRNLIREIIGARWPEGTDSRNPKDVPLDVNNHALDDVRYAIFTDRVGTRRAQTTAMKMRPQYAKHGVLIGGNGGVANGNGRGDGYLRSGSNGNGNGRH